MKDRIYNAMQKFASAIIRPVMFMAVAGIIIAITALLRIESMPTIFNTIGEFFFTMLTNGMIGNLSVIFSVGLASALAKEKKVDAAILGITTFLVFLQANNFWLTHTNQLAEAGEFGLAGTGQAMVLGVQSTDMGVFLGILLGVITGYVHNKCKDVKFHKYFVAYEGTKFAFIVLILVSSVLGIAVTYIWPPINDMIMALVTNLSEMGSLGYFLYGVLNRLALPFGLHHLLWMPIYYTPLGGVAEIASETYSGAMNIWYAELGNISQISEIHPSVGYVVNFGYTALPLGIMLAFIKTAYKENKEEVTGQTIPPVISSFLAGITEPIEFMFLFTAPMLWVAHSIIYGFGLWFASVVGLNTYVGNLIETILFSLSIPIELGRQWLIPIVFIVLTIIEYFVFVFLIEKFDLKTPGRIKDNTKPIDEKKELNQNELPEDSQYALLVDALGGVDNIKYINNCYTRLRIDTENANLIDEELLQKYPSKGNIVRGNHVQIVIGMGVEDVRNGFERYCNKESEE